MMPDPETPAEKVCIRCHQSKPLDSFHLRVTGRTERVGRCKACVSAANKAPIEAAYACGHVVTVTAVRKTIVARILCPSCRPEATAKRQAARKTEKKQRHLDHLITCLVEKYN